MGKPLSKPDCLRRGPRCLGKGDGEDGGIEDCYIPQRSIYDTVRINEQIDQGSASSTLGSGAGEGSTLSTNGTLAAGGVSRPGSGKKLDERQIFDALKLSVDPQSRPPGEGGASVSPGASSCSSALGVVRRSAGAERNDSNRRSWKTFLPPEFVEETMEKQESGAPPCMAPPSAGSSLLISPYSSSPHIPPASGSSPQTSTVTSLVALQPNVLSTPALVSATNQQPSSLRLDPALFAPTRPGRKDGAEQAPDIRRSSFQGPQVAFRTAMGAEVRHDRESPVPEPDSDTALLLPPLVSPPLALSATPTERTWPRRLLGRRRTVSQGGVLHNLPVLPPLPPLLADYRSMNEESVRLLGHSMQAAELRVKEKDWMVLQQLEEEEEEGSEVAVEQSDEAGWDAVLRQVDSLWEPLMGGADIPGWDPQCTGSLSRWPLLRPPAGFGGSEPPSGPGSELGSDDLELEVLNEEPGETAGLIGPQQPLGAGPTPPDCCQLPRTLTDLDPHPQEQEDKEEPGSSKAETHKIAVQQPDSNHCSSSGGSGLLDSGSSGDRVSSAGNTGSTESPEKDPDLQTQGTEEKLPGRSDVSKDVSMETQDGGNEPRCQMGDGEGAKEKIHDDGAEMKEEELKSSTRSQEVISAPSRLPEKRRAEGEEHGVDGIDLPLPLSPSKHEVRGLAVEGKEADAFVATDSFIYLAVSALPPFPQETKPASLEGSEPPSPGALPHTWQEENDFLSTDSFVYLAAPERLPLTTAGSCTCGDSQASSSEDSRSGVDFVLGSMTGDSDWDSDGSGSEPAPNQQDWDHWEELEPAVLPDLFCDDTPDQESQDSELCDHRSSGSEQEAEHGLEQEAEHGSEKGAEPRLEEEAERGLEQEAESSPTVTPTKSQLQVLMDLFSETLAQLEPWLEETETVMEHLPPPDVDPEALRQQQDHFRILRECVSEHQADVRKLQLIGAPLAKLSGQEGTTVRQRCSSVERRYLAVKEKVTSHGAVLQEAIFQTSQFHEKMDSLLETLEKAAQRLRQRPPVAVEVEKIQEQLAVHRAAGWELDKLLPSYSALCVLGEKLLMCEDYAHLAGQAMREQLVRLQSVWDEIRQRADEREAKLLEALSLAEAFRAKADLLQDTLRDTQHVLDVLEAPGVDPFLIKHQVEVAEAVRKEVDGLWQRVGTLRSLGAELITTCGETDKQHVMNKQEEICKAWDGLNRTCGDRKERLEEALMSSLQYQHALQTMFAYLDRAMRELSDMSSVAVDLGSITQQMEELKLYKAGVHQQQVAMETLSHKGAALLQRAADPADRNKIQEPLSVLRDLWEHLGGQIVQRQHQVEAALLAMGQLPYALSELQSWFSQSHAFLNTQQPTSCDPKSLETELARNRVLKKELLSRSSTLERICAAGWELVGTTAGDQAQHVQEQLDSLSRAWENLLLKVQAQQNLLETSLQKAECYHAELEEILKWLTLTESRLEEAQATGGLPEMAREQLQRHMVLQEQLAQRVDQYHHLLDQMDAFQVDHGKEDEAGLRTAQTLQKLTLLQDKWTMISTKMEEKKVRLEQVVALAMSFQASLQMCINWLIQAEQALNMAPPPSLILDTILLQIDQHQEFMTALDSHRDLVEALESAGARLGSVGLEQDVVLVRSLLLRVQARWDQLVQSSLEREQRLEKARTTAEQFKGVWLDLWEWLQEADGKLDVDLETTDDPEKINSLLAEHKEFQKVLRSKRPVFYTTVRFCRTIREQATLPADTLKLGNLLGKIRDKWDCICGRSVDRQRLLEEVLLQVGQVAAALHGVFDWLLGAEPQLGEEQPVHGDLGLVAHLVDSHKVLQQELSKRAASVEALKRSTAELMDKGWSPSIWEKMELEELSRRWDSVCVLSVNRQLRLQQALKQAEEFRSAVQRVRAWLSGAEQSLQFRGVLPDELEPLQNLLHNQRELMEALQEKRPDVDKAMSMGQEILSACHPDSITPIRQAVAALQARFQEVLTWAKLHQQRLERALLELQDSAAQLDDLQSWLLWADTVLAQREAEPVPQDVPRLRALVVDHQAFMEEVVQKQTDVERVSKAQQSKGSGRGSSPADKLRTYEECSSRWQQVWQRANACQRRYNDALYRAEELAEGPVFDFDVWRERFMCWLRYRKTGVMDVFRPVDTDQDGRITRLDFIECILASKFPTNQQELTSVADIFDQNGDGHIDYYQFVATLLSNRELNRVDKDSIEDEVLRQVVQCRCLKRFQVELMGTNKYKFWDSECSVRMLFGYVLVQLGGTWVDLDQFLLKYDPCRASSSTSCVGRRLSRKRGGDM